MAEPQVPNDHEGCAAAWSILEHLWDGDWRTTHPDWFARACIWRDWYFGDRASPWPDPPASESADAREVTS